MKRLVGFALGHMLALAVSVLPVRRGVPHQLANKLVVSLTSYPARYPTLHLTLWLLLSQTIAPDVVVLWVAGDAAPLLPRAVRALQGKGLTIRNCDDLRSFRKIVPALEAYPDAIIVTADDDIAYRRDWLAGLVGGIDPARREIICYRARRIIFDGAGFAPYRSWPVAVPGDDAIVATGMGGVLYPPGALDARAVDRQLFMRLCPTADDIWLHWMARLTGTPTRIAPTTSRFLQWPGSQAVRLGRLNVDEGENDRVLARLSGHFGYPGTATEPPGSDDA